MTDSTEIDWTDETLRPLDELARIAFPEEAGITAGTLKRRARQGKLKVYRPGKAYLSTLADVRAMVEATRVGPPPPRPARWPDVPNGLGLTESELATMRLERIIQKLIDDEKEKRRIAREQRQRDSLMRKSQEAAERREARRNGHQR